MNKSTGQELRRVSEAIFTLLKAMDASQEEYQALHLIAEYAYLKSKEIERDWQQTEKASPEIRLVD